LTFSLRIIDRLLDFSTAVTDGLFFMSSADLLEELAKREP
jgi:putative iron-dependent peroxidase